jgi:SAM-dependent methyltransferase
MLPLVAVALISAGALAFEVLLVRMFSIAQWYHFAYMVISIAMLGYGASGTLISLGQSCLLARGPLAVAVSAALFAISVPVSFAVAQSVPLNVLELVWDPTQVLRLFVVSSICAVPFFFAATAIGIQLMTAGERVGHVYRSDLTGAAAGALLIVAALFVAEPGTCLKGIAVLGLAGAAAAARGTSLPRAAIVACLGAGIGAVLLWPASWAAPRPSPYKELSLALQVPGARVLAETSNPLGRLTAVANPNVPFRAAAGLSLSVRDPIPEQIAVFTDAGAPTAITRFRGDVEEIRYLDAQTTALPYHLIERPRVLVLGAGGGADVLLALLFRASPIDAVDLNPDMIRLVQDDFADFAGGIYAHPSVRAHVTEARSFVRNGDERYDIIQIALLDSFNAAAAGLQALHESNLYTVEAFGDYLDRLRPGGILAITRWVKVPPRDSLKLFATAITALERRGSDAPERHLALIRSWSTSTLLVRNGVFSAEDGETIRAFSRDRGFDVDYLQGIEAREVNRFNILDRPYDFEGASALLGEGRARFIADYKFDIRPATDDRPYFFHFLKASTLLELTRLPERSGLNLLEWGYPVLLATLATAVAGGALLILVPIVPYARRRSPVRQTGIGVWLGVLVYFSALGLAFLFVEIAFIQRLQVFLGHPLFAVSVTLSAFLLFAGLGAGLSGRWSRYWRCRSDHAAAAAAFSVAVLALVCFAGLDRVLAAGVALPLPLKVVVAGVVIAPVALFMGMPFPLGLATTSQRASHLLPWAWAVNGCSSVISAVLSTLIALHFGFSAVLAAAALLYAVAALTVVISGRAAARAVMSPSV